MTERLSNKNPCINCKADRQIGNPNRREYECDSCDKPIDWKSECVKKLAEYETAEEEGRLVVFPCKVGDILFVITPDSPIGIETTKCIRLSIDKRGIKIQAPAVHDDWGNAKWNFKPIDFGKKVFLDFEEAKKALREREEDQ